MTEPLLRRSRARRFRPALAKALRLEARLTQADIARELHVTVAAVSRWEAGLQTPPGPRAERYARLLDRIEKELRRE